VEVKKKRRKTIMEYFTGEKSNTTAPEQNVEKLKDIVEEGSKSDGDISPSIITPSKKRGGFTFLNKTKGCDTSDPALQEAVDEVRNEKSNTDWVIFGYVNQQQQDKLAIHSKGSTTEAFLDAIRDIKGVYYAYLRINIKNTVVKYVFVSWVTDDLPVMEKAKANVNFHSVEKFLKHYNLQIHAASVEVLKNRLSMLESQKTRKFLTSPRGERGTTNN